jgi:hypothetical protein
VQRAANPVLTTARCIANGWFARHHTEVVKWLYHGIIISNLGACGSDRWLYYCYECRRISETFIGDRCVAGIRDRYACGLAGAPLRDADVQRIVETAAHRLVRLLQQRGILDEAEVDTLVEKEPLLAALSAAVAVGVD